MIRNDVLLHHAKGSQKLSVRNFYSPDTETTHLTKAVDLTRELLGIVDRLEPGITRLRGKLKDFRIILSPKLKVLKIKSPHARFT